MSLEDQLKKLFPDHVSEENDNKEMETEHPFWIGDETLKCIFEKRKGKPVTIIDGYNGTNQDFKKLTQSIQRELKIGGSFKDEKIILQGNFRDKIMEILKSYGFSVKRVGG